jgi:DnaJ-class molecular chaperone
VHVSVRPFLLYSTNDAPWEADMKTCPDCNGDGVIDKGTDDEKQCPTCGGSGFVPDDNDDKNNGEVIRTSWEVP